MTVRESDQFIVLRGRESRSHGEGIDRDMQLAKETCAGHVGLDQHMPTSLQGIADKANRIPKHRFQNLYQLLNEETMRYAWKRINKRAVAGVDQVTANQFSLYLPQYIEGLVGQLKRKQYRVKAVKSVLIPKENGKTRALGIPTVQDKLLQGTAALILQSIYEQDFLPCSYGYRPGTGAQKAVKDLTKELNFGNYHYIVEADILGFFDHMDHEWIMDMLGQRVDDQTFLGVIKKWLKADVLKSDGKYVEPTSGSAQGGTISPILANIYLHYAVDVWFEHVVKPYSQGNAYLCRYADDFVCAFERKEDAQRFYRTLSKRLGKFKLEVSIEKTRIIPFSKQHKESGESFTFLGFEYRWGMSRKGKGIIQRKTAKKKWQKSLQNFKVWCKENRNKRIKVIFDRLNRKLRGYYNYYGVIGNYPSLYKFYEITKEILFKWLNRRSQRRSFNWRQFERVLRLYRIQKPRIVERS